MASLEIFLLVYKPSCPRMITKKEGMLNRFFLGFVNRTVGITRNIFIVNQFAYLDCIVEAFLAKEKDSLRERKVQHCLPINGRIGSISTFFMNNFAS